MDYESGPEISPRTRLDPSRAAVKGAKILEEERNMHAISDAPSLNATQRPVSFLGWGLTLILGAVLWSVIFYVI